MDDSNKTGLGMVAVALILLVIGGFCCLLMGAGFFFVRTSGPTGGGGPMPGFAVGPAISYRLGAPSIAQQADGTSVLVVDLHNTGGEEWTTFVADSAVVSDQDGLPGILADPTVTSIPSPSGPNQPSGRRLTFMLPKSTVVPNASIRCDLSIKVDVSTPVSSHHAMQSSGITIPIPLPAASSEKDASVPDQNPESEQSPESERSKE